MTTRKKKKRSKHRSSHVRSEVPKESRAAEALTIGWTMTCTTLFFCHLTAIVVHYYVVGHPDEKRLMMLRELLLFAGAVVGIVSLALLPLVYRFRQVALPRGLAVFGVCLAAAPIFALILRTVH